MIVLSMDTSAVTASVALLENSSVIGSFDIHNKLTHSEKLLPMIDNLLTNAGYTVDDIGLIGVSVGPGSFTGVRIGVSTAKGLALPNNIPIVAVSALEALAENFSFLTEMSFDKVIIAPSMDARRNELYNALFSYDGKLVSRLTEDRPITCDELFVELEKYGLPVLINGDGAKKLFDFLSDKTSVNKALLPELLQKQNAVSVGKIAYKKFLNGEYTDALKIAPLYLRTSQAERVNNIKEDKS